MKLNLIFNTVNSEEASIHNIAIKKRMHAQSVSKMMGSGNDLICNNEIRGYLAKYRASPRKGEILQEE